MTTEYILVFECCENEVNLGYDRSVGMHDQHCLACDAENPMTHIETR